MTKTISSSQRIYSIDVLRGAVMVIMALDHVRDFFHYTASTDSPTNLMTTTAPLFFTRWITHFCAPTFVFLAGISAWLMGQKKTIRQLASFLITRGFWLIGVEVFIVTLAWTYNPFYNLIILQVIWAIGLSMIILGCMVWLPSNFILLMGLMIIGLHNLLDNAELSRHGQVNLFWELAHHGNFKVETLSANHLIIIVYAFLPWTGIMLTGYGLGRIFTQGFNAVNRRRILFGLGSAFLLLFVLLRFLNHYGDPAPWQMQRSPLFSLLSFINLSKYPPSLDYITMTLGVAMIILGLLDRISRNSFPFLRVFGTVPFFFYVLHIYLIHAITVIVFFIQGYPPKDILPQHSPFLFRPDHFGFHLPGVYLIWALVILILYPLCIKYNRYKSTHTQWWLSYL
jgi:uncharacterized membrane protein